jgi:hypothetical protein
VREIKDSIARAMTEDDLWDVEMHRRTQDAKDAKITQLRAEVIECRTLLEEVYEQWTEGNILPATMERVRQEFRKGWPS